MDFNRWQLGLNIFVQELSSRRANPRCEAPMPRRLSGLLLREHISGHGSGGEMRIPRTGVVPMLARVTGSDPSLTVDGTWKYT